LFTTLLLSSCETYDDYDTDRKDVIGFVFGTFATGMNPGQTITFPIAKYFVTTSSPVERTFQVAVVESLTGVTSDNYSFDSTVVIPANEQIGNMTVTLINNSLPAEPTDLILAFVSPTDGSITSGGHAIFKLNSN